MAKKVIEEDFATRKLEIVSSDEMKKKSVKKTRKVKEEQPRKKSNAGGYFLLILLLVVAGCLTYYWYKEVYKKDTGVVNEVVDKKLGYSFVTYKSDKKLKMINDSYVIEYEDNTLYKVLDKDGKLLFDDKIDFTDVYMDRNNNLYVIFDEGTDLGNLLSLYKLENSKFVLVNDYSEVGFYFNTIVYRENDYDYLFAISKVSQKFEETENVNELIFVDSEEKIKLDKGIYLGNINVDSFITLSDRYLPVNNQEKVGLYDLTKKELVIDYTYDSLELVNSENNLLKVKKNLKYAIINMNLKKLIDYKYNYIDYHNDYIIVGNDNKIGVLNKEYKDISGLVIDCEYDMFNTLIDSYKIGDKIVLKITTLYEEDKYNIYVISSDGKVEKYTEDLVVEDDIRYSVSSDNKTYTIYNENMENQGVIDLNQYDFETRVSINKVGDTIVVGEDIYYDATSLEQIDRIKEYEVVKDLYKLVLKNDNTVSVLIDGKSIGTYNYESYVDFYQETKDGVFYYISDNNYVTIKKVNE